MFEGNTFFFVGAGASVSYGFPVGSKLIEEICYDLESGSELKHYLTEKAGFKATELERFSSQFKEARFSTIDEFLEKQPRLKDLAKIAVGLKLIEYENPKRLEENRYDWFSVFLRERFKSVNDYTGASPMLHTFNVHTLNYDRSIEHILYTFLNARFGDGSDWNRNFLAWVHNVYHAHGRIGNYGMREDWEDRPYSTNYPDPDYLNALLEQIIFWDDRSNNPTDWGFMNCLLKSSENIVFLGFGFHEKILDRISQDILSDRSKKIFATTMGLSNKKLNRLLGKFDKGLASYTSDNDQIEGKWGHLQLAKRNQTCDSFVQELRDELCE